MGVGIDAYDQGARMGIAAAATIAYDHRSAEATRAVFAASAENAREYARGTRSTSVYCEKQKRAAGDLFAGLFSNKTKSGEAGEAAVEEGDRRRYQFVVGRRSRYASPFGASVSVALAEARMTQTELAAKTGRSTAYVNQLITGHKKPSPEWVDLIADTLKLSPKDRQALHVAAAKQHGFKLDLTKK